MTPGKIRDTLAGILDSLKEVEGVVDNNIRQGRFEYAEVGHEVVEASSDLERAISYLDQNYKRLQ